MLVSFDSSCKELKQGIIMLNFIVSTFSLALDPGGGGVHPFLGYTGTCRWTGYGFLASLS